MVDRMPREWDKPCSVQKTRFHSLHLLALGLGCLAACASPLPGDDAPKSGVFYYPTGIATAPGAEQILVVSSNFDQRYNTGWVSAIDIKKVVELQGVPANGVVHPNDVMSAPKRLRVPSLGGKLAVDGSLRTAVLGHRGIGRVSVLTLGAANNLDLACGQGGDIGPADGEGYKPVCEGINLVEALSPLVKVDPVAFIQYEDPYAVAIFPDGKNPGALLAAVGYLGGPWVSVFDVKAGTANPALTPLRNISIGSGALLNLIKHPMPDRTAVYLTGTSHASSGNVDRSFLYDIDITSSLSDAQDVVQRRDVGHDLGFVMPQTLAEISAVAFSTDGQTAYATHHGINTHGDGVVVLKNLGPESQTKPTMTTVGALALDRSQPTDILLVHRPAGDLLVVASLSQDTLYFLAPQGDSVRLVHRMEGDNVGHGPFAMVHTNYRGRDYLFVTTFFDHGVTVIDITEARPSAFKRLARILDASYGVAARAAH